MKNQEKFEVYKKLLKKFFSTFLEGKLLKTLTNKPTNITFKDKFCKFYQLKQHKIMCHKDHN